MFISNKKFGSSEEHYLSLVRLNNSLFEFHMNPSKNLHAWKVL